MSSSGKQPQAGASNPPVVAQLPWTQVTTQLPPPSPSIPPVPELMDVDDSSSGSDDQGGQTVTTTVPTEPIHTIKTVQIKEPDLYFGDRRKLTEWLYQVDIYVRFNRERLGTTEDQVLFASTYLRDRA